MVEPAIRVEDLGKRYRIGGQRAPYGRFTETAMGVLAAPLRRWRRKRPPAAETFWALDAVSFDVMAGDTLGIIGANGSGKSTLLKIISRITEPTRGRVETHGRVGSLLEIGTGFHPELTGRENIYLSGAILGMKRYEINRRFDEIVEFSEIAQFLETPVKHYSSGMYIRLAFAVAAHLETEILLVDEVLAVGDFRFQKKCLGKMSDVAHRGRTVLFVSHNMPAVKGLCRRALLLDRGQIKADGEVGAVVTTYLTREDVVRGDGIVPEGAPRIVGTGEALLRRVALRDRDGRAITQVMLGQPFQVSAVYEVKRAVEEAVLEIGVSTVDGLRLATVTSMDEEPRPVGLRPGRWEITAELKVTLLPGQYAVDVFLHNADTGITIDWVERTFVFAALDVPEPGKDYLYYHRFSPERGFPIRGFVRPESTWRAPVPAAP